MTEASSENWPTRQVKSHPLAIGEKAKLFGCFPLYTMRGLAPTYHTEKLGGKYKNVTMNWFRARTHPLRINYGEVFGRDDYTEENAWAVNQLFLKEEAGIFKRWMDAVYPEENTQIYRVQFPIESSPVPFQTGYSEEKGVGIFNCYDGRWTFDWVISYWVDVSECEFLGVDP